MSWQPLTWCYSVSVQGSQLSTAGGSAVRVRVRVCVCEREGGREGENVDERMCAVVRV